MKLKDIKPGMVVAIGSMRSINAQWGGGWEGNGRRAVVVAKGKFEKARSFGWIRQHIGDTGLRETSWPGAKTTVLVALAYRKGDECRPEVVPASKVLMPWDEYLEKVEEEKQEKAKLRKEQEDRVIARSNRFDKIAEKTKPLGIEIFEVYQTHYWDSHLMISFDDMDKLLAKLEK
jgi:hypothetical protein